MRPPPRANKETPRFCRHQTKTTLHEETLLKQWQAHEKSKQQQQPLFSRNFEQITQPTLTLSTAHTTIRLHLETATTLKFTLKSTRLGCSAAVSVTALRGTNSLNKHQLLFDKMLRTNNTILDSNHRVACWSKPRHTRSHILHSINTLYTQSRASFKDVCRLLGITWERFIGVGPARLLAFAFYSFWT